MRLTTASISKPGGRKVNEDCCGHELLPTGLGCWVVADGLGGHGGGDVASRLVTDTILNRFLASPEITAETLNLYIESAQAALIKQQEMESELDAMRSTVAVLLSDGRSALWGYVGDTRLYHFRAGRIISQTKDHSVPQALANSGDIAQDDIRHHEDRNRLLRAMGNPGKLRPTIETVPVSLQHGDALLLCTDGFWEYVTEIEMGIGLAKSTTAQEWLAFLEVTILRRAPSTHDNYTGTAVFVEDQ